MFSYIACPYSHEDKDVERKRFETASVFASLVFTVCGDLVYSPLSHTHPIHIYGDGNIPHDEWLRLDKMYLDSQWCNTMYVLMIDGWYKSKGVVQEINRAREMMIDIVYVVPNNSLTCFATSNHSTNGATLDSVTDLDQNRIPLKFSYQFIEDAMNCHGVTNDVNKELAKWAARLREIGDDVDLGTWLLSESTKEVDVKRVEQSNAAKLHYCINTLCKWYNWAPSALTTLTEQQITYLFDMAALAGTEPAAQRVIEQKYLDFQMENFTEELETLAELQGVKLPEIKHVCIAEEVCEVHEEFEHCSITYEKGVNGVCVSETCDPIGYVIYSTRKPEHRLRGYAGCGGWVCSVENSRSQYFGFGTIAHACYPPANYRGCTLRFTDLATQYIPCGHKCEHEIVGEVHKRYTDSGTYFYCEHCYNEALQQCYGRSVNITAPLDDSLIGAESHSSQTPDPKNLPCLGCQRPICRRGQLTCDKTALLLPRTPDYDEQGSTLPTHCEKCALPIATVGDAHLLLYRSPNPAQCERCYYGRWRDLSYIADVMNGEQWIHDCREDAGLIVCCVCNRQIVGDGWNYDTSNGKYRHKGCCEETQIVGECLDVTMRPVCYSCNKAIDTSPMLIGQQFFHVRCAEEFQAYQEKKAAKAKRLELNLASVSKHLQINIDPINNVPPIENGMC